MNPLSLALVAIGGAIGSVSRSLFSTFVLRVTGSLLPVGTFAVNVVGCVAFGAIVGAAEHRFVLTPETRAFLLVGILGGFTTFSSFMLDTFTLGHGGDHTLAFWNVAAQTAFGLAAVWAGYRVGVSIG